MITAYVDAWYIGEKRDLGQTKTVVNMGKKAVFSKENDYHCKVPSDLADFMLGYPETFKVDIPGADLSAQKPSQDSAQLVELETKFMALIESIEERINLISDEIRGLKPEAEPAPEPKPLPAKKPGRKRKPKG